jgi:hypothetical protein
MERIFSHENKIAVFNENFNHIVSLRDETLMESWLYKHLDRLMDLYLLDDKHDQILVKFYHNSNKPLIYDSNNTFHLMHAILVTLSIKQFNEKCKQHIRDHEQYNQRLVETFKSVVDQTKIPYWDDNLLGIISKYTCMLYFPE